MTDPPKAAPYWAKHWGVHRNTARKLLAHLHRQYGSKVVWRTGKRKSHVATHASLQVVKIMRAERNLILVLDRPTEHPQAVTRGRAHDTDEAVCQEQFARAMGELWGALKALKAR